MKYWISILAIFAIVSNSFLVSAETFHQSVKKAIDKAPKNSIHNPVIPKKFRQSMLIVFGSGTYDKINNDEKIFANISNEIFPVLNTQKLGWFTKNHLIHFARNCRYTEVVKGINKNGEIICGQKSSHLLTKIRITGGNGKMIDKAKNSRKDLKKDDIIDVENTVTITTEREQTLEIAFEDNSVIRLETDTSILLSPVKKPDATRTLAEVSYNKWLLWGRVTSPDGPLFRHGEIVAWVRGTSVLMTPERIYTLQSQNEKEAMTLFHSEWTQSTPKCSAISVKNLETSHIANDEYCLGVKGKKIQEAILRNTKRDITYLNMLIAKKEDNEMIQKEREIAWPQRVENNITFCTDPKKPVFWPKLLNLNEICQEDNIFAIATITKAKAELIYREGNNFTTITGNVIATHTGETSEYHVKFDYENITNNQIRQQIQEIVKSPTRTKFKIVDTAGIDKWPSMMIKNNLEDDPEVRILTEKEDSFFIWKGEDKENKFRDLISTNGNILFFK